MQARARPPSARSEVAVQWTTRDAGTPRVRWGPAPGDYPSSAPADSSTYARADMCGPPANTTGWVDPGTFHLGVIGGLEPSRRYYYIYGDEVRPGGGWVCVGGCALGVGGQIRVGAARARPLQCSGPPSLPPPPTTHCPPAPRPVSPPRRPQEFGWSEEASFVAPPATGPGASVTLLAIADLGQAEEDGSLEM